MTSSLHHTKRLATAVAMLTCLAALHADARAEDSSRHARDVKLFATYQSMLDEDPYQPYALRRLLEVSHVKGGLTGLVTDYEDRVRQDAVATSDWIVLGHLYSATDRHEDAAHAYDSAANMTPNDWRPHRAKAQLFRKVERWDDSLTAFDAALTRTRRNTERVELWQEAADAALEGKNLTRGLSYFAAMRAANPGKPFLQMEAAATLARRGYPKASLEAWATVRKRVGRTLKHLVVIWRQMATLQEEVGDLAAAEATWREGLEVLPKSHWARPSFLKGLVSVFRRRDALPDLIEEFTRGKVTDRATQLMLAHLQEEMGRDDLARAWLMRAVAQNKRDVATRRRLIQVLERTGPVEELIAQHEALVKIARGEPRYELDLASLYFQKNQLKRGFRLLDRLGKRYRSDPGVHQRIIDLTMRYGGDPERPRIERAYRTLIRLEPREEGHVISLGEYWWSTGDRDRARQAWRRLRTMGANQGLGHLAHAEVLSDHGLVTEAREAFDTAMKAAPDNTRIIRTYALLLEAQKLNKEAVALWRRVLKTEKHATKVTEARRHIVQLWHRGGQTRRQEAALKHQFAADPPDLDAGFFLVELLLSQRAFDRAQRVLERLRTLAPDRVETLTALERLLTRKDQLPEAIDVLENLARLNPREAYDYLHRAADLALARGDLSRALETTRRVVALNPADPSAHDRVGDLYRRMGRMNEAVTAWRQVLLLDPRNDRVRFKLSDIYRTLNQPDRERQELIHIVRETSQPADALKAGRRLLQVAIATSGLRDVEDALRPLAVQRAGRSDVYLKLLIDVFVASTRAIRWSDVPSATKERELKSLGERALRPLLQGLAESDVALRARALEVIRATHPPGAVPALARLLSTQTTAARITIVGSLGAIGTPSATEALARLFEEGSGDGQRLAIWALGLARAPEALDRLIAIASSRHTHHRILAAWAMGRRADKRAIPTLQQLARSADTRQRLAAVWALVQVADPAATGALGHALRSADPVERRLASQGLARIGTTAAHRLIIAQLWRHADRPSGHLGEALSHADTTIDDAAIETAYVALADTTRGRLREDNGPLLAATQFPPPTTEERLAATRRLMPLLIEHLTTVLSGDATVMAERAMQACVGPTGTLMLAPLIPPSADDAKTRALLHTLWSRSETALREMALGTLGASIQANAMVLLAKLSDTPLSKDTVNGVLEALNSPWPDVQAAALALLTGDQIGSDTGHLAAVSTHIQTWLEADDRTDAVRIAIAQALGRLATNAPLEAASVRALQQLLADSRTTVRLATIRTVAQLDHDDLLEALVDRVSDPVADVARAALDALHKSRRPQARALLQDVRRNHLLTPFASPTHQDFPTPP